MVGCANAFHLQFDAFLAQNTVFDVSEAFGAVLGNVGLLTFTASCCLPTPLPKVAHPKALPALGGGGGLLGHGWMDGGGWRGQGSKLSVVSTKAVAEALLTMKPI